MYVVTAPLTRPATAGTDEFTLNADFVKQILLARSTGNIAWFVAGATMLIAAVYVLRS